MLKECGIVTVVCVALLFQQLIQGPSYLDLIFDKIDGTTESLSNNLFLHGNFGPIEGESCSFNLKASTGAVPKEMNGVFVRTGPNPKYQPVSRHHWFDGDGMWHVIRVKDGQVNYCNSYIQTDKLRMESSIGQAIVPGLGAMENGKASLAAFAFKSTRLWLLQAMGSLPKIEPLRRHTANTNVVNWAGKTSALVEASWPFQMSLAEDGSMTSIDFDTYNGTLDHCMTAHPKIDARTEQFYFFCYNVVTTAGLYEDKVEVSSLNAAGVKGPSTKINHLSKGAGAPFMHDMGLTEKYFVLIDGSLRLDPESVVKGTAANMVHMNTDVPIRVGLVKREAVHKGEDSVQWISLERPGHIYHVANSWEDEAGDIHIWVFWYVNGFHMEQFSGKQTLPQYTKTRAHAMEWVVSPTTGVVQINQPDASNLIFGEFPRINDHFFAYPNKFMYYAGYTDMERNGLEFTVIAKFNFLTNSVQTVPFGGIGGEIVFTPMAKSPLDYKSFGKGGKYDEDDGYLSVIVFVPEETMSYYKVWSAKSLELVSSVNLGRRVPYGFHAAWWDASDVVFAK